MNGRRSEDSPEEFTDLPVYVFVLPWDLNPDGGVNQVVINLYREMLVAGEMQPLVMVSKWGALRSKETIVDGRRIIYMRLWSPWVNRSSILGLAKWILVSPIYLGNLILLCHRYRIKVFNIHYISPGVFPIALLRFLGIYRGQLILSFHGADLHNAENAGFVERGILKFLIRHATSIVACSRSLAADIDKFVGATLPRVNVVTNGLDINYFRNEAEIGFELPVALKGREFILSVATFERKKGLDTLLRAFAEIRQEIHGLALVLIGMPGGAECELRKLAADLDVSNDVLFIEGIPHSQISGFLRAAKVFCLPSRAEPFGIAILEAGAYRLPVVASRVGGIPEIIEDGESGLLVEPNSTEELVVALKRVMNDPQLAETLGNNLFKRVESEFSWKRAYEKYRKLL